MSLTTFIKFVQLRMKERMEYRAAFLFGIIGQIIGYGGGYIVVWMLLHRFQHLGGWTWPEIALLYSIGIFTYSLGASFTFVQMREIESMVRDGSFDGILVKPANPYMYIVARQYNLGYIAHIIISGSILLWSLSQLPIVWDAAKVLYFILIIISGSMIQAGIMTVIGAWSFIFIRSGFLFSLFFRLKDFISYPISIYHIAVQVVLVLFVPLAFVNYYPSAFLLSKQTELLSGIGVWLAPAVGPLCLWISYKIWMLCANKYQGAGG